MEVRSKISEEDVIEKLKDDGDFDRLRLKIIRKLKDNEELRSSIASIVKQSVALTRAGTENVKPRQVSDAIYEEVGDEIMSKVSDNLWEIIRSADGMQSEITETVQSVYNKLAFPKVNEDAGTSAHYTEPVIKEADNNGSMMVSTSEFELPETDPAEPPGFSRASNNVHDEKQPLEELKLPKHTDGGQSRQIEEGHNQNNVGCSYNVDLPPGFSSNIGANHMSNDASSDEDPDVPPGFG